MKNAPLSPHISYGRNGRVLFLLLLFLIMLISYSNSWHAAWHFDDWPNIVQNTNLHLEHLSPQAILKTFLAKPTAPGRLYRPIACFSFALNWYLSQDTPYSYHVVNFLIHFLTACFLFFTLQIIFKTPRMAPQQNADAFFICVLSTILWTINPIQTQAVIYIVQRMASLAALFYIMGLFCYLKARLADEKQIGIRFLVGSALCYLFALLSKENAALFPFSLLLLEWAFFNRQKNLPMTPNMLKLIAGAFLILLLSTLFLRQGHLLGVFSGYQHRNFTLTERLLTQPRIIFFYLSLLFYPLPNRLSLEHDVIVSTGLFTPWTTFPAILGIIILIGLGCFWLRKKPLLGFPILFFLLNHGIESTIIPLEMIFEHRNYLPSVFIFLPPAAGMKYLINRYTHENKLISGLCYAGIALIIMFFGLGTYVRNMAWETEKTLWEDVLTKTKDAHHRAYHNLAWSYYQRQGMTNKAIEYYLRALENPNTIGPDTLNNLALLYLQHNAYDRSIFFAKEAIRVTPYFDEAAHYYLATALLKIKKWPQALEQIDRLLSKNQSNPLYYNPKGLILINQKKYRMALAELKRSLHLNPSHWQTLTYIGAAFTKLGRYRKAGWFLRYANAIHPDSRLILLCLINNCIQHPSNKPCSDYLDTFFSHIPIAGLNQLRSLRAEPEIAVLIPMDAVFSYIARNLKMRVEDFINTNPPSPIQ